MKDFDSKPTLRRVDIDPKKNGWYIFQAGFQVTYPEDWGFGEADALSIINELWINEDEALFRVEN